MRNPNTKKNLNDTKGSLRLFRIPKLRIDKGLLEVQT